MTASARVTYQAGRGPLRFSSLPGAESWKLGHGAGKHLVQTCVMLCNRAPAPHPATGFTPTLSDPWGKSFPTSPQPPVKFTPSYPAHQAACITVLFRAA